MVASSKSDFFLGRQQSGPIISPPSSPKTYDSGPQTSLARTSSGGNVFARGIVKAAASGETLTSVVFEFKRAIGTGTEVFQTVRLTNAILSSVKTLNGGIQPTEEVTFTFQEIEYENKDGAAAAPASWSSGSVGGSLASRDTPRLPPHSEISNSGDL